MMHYLGTPLDFFFNDVFRPVFIVVCVISFNRWFSNSQWTLLLQSSEWSWKKTCKLKWQAYWTSGAGQRSDDWFYCSVTSPSLQSIRSPKIRHHLYKYWSWLVKNSSIPCGTRESVKEAGIHDKTWRTSVNASKIYVQITMILQCYYTPFQARWGQWGPLIFQREAFFKRGGLKDVVSDIRL